MRFSHYSLHTLCNASMCNGSFCVFYGIPLLEFISIHFVRKEMYNAVPISFLLFHECTLVMHTCTLNRIWCMDMCIRMECKPFHRPHRFEKKTNWNFFLWKSNKQTKETHENGRLEKREKVTKSKWKHCAGIT